MHKQCAWCGAEFTSDEEIYRYVLTTGEIFLHLHCWTNGACTRMVTERGWKTDYNYYIDRRLPPMPHMFRH